MSQAEILRNLKIKTNSLSRLHKELQYYIKEKDKEQNRVDKMKSDNADPYDIRQAENVLTESAMMVPETRQRMEAALSELRAYLNDNSQDVAETPELVAAQELLGGIEATA